MDSSFESDIPSNVFHQILNESGSPIFSNSLSIDPQNMAQVAGQKKMKKSPLHQHHLLHLKVISKDWLMHKEILPVLFSLW